MLSRLLFLSLLLSLTPSFAHAQAPVVWSMVASTCVPDDTAVPLLRVNSHYVTVLPGQLTPVVRGVPQPIRVRCPVTLQGRWRLDALSATLRDPDGQGRPSRLLVDLKRLALTVFGGVVPLQVAQLDTSRIILLGGQDETLTVQVFPTVLDFGQETYWIEVSLVRTSPLVLPPRLYTVRLHAVPDPP